MFIGILIFLCSVNLLAAKLWGDVYLNITQNITAAEGAETLRTVALDKPLESANNFVRVKSENSLAGIQLASLHTDYGKTFGSLNSGKMTINPEPKNNS